jgi:hypothetical protein
MYSCTERHPSIRIWRGIPHDFQILIVIARIAGWLSRHAQQVLD